MTSRCNFLKRSTQNLVTFAINASLKKNHCREKDNKLELLNV